MFQTGDIIVYRHHVCEIAGIRKNYFEDKDYVELHALFENSLKLFVPKTDAKPPTLRATMTKKEALDLIDSIAYADPINEKDVTQGPATATIVEKRMREEYDKLLKTFTPEDLVPIIKSVYARTEHRMDTGRRITATDKRYFNLAENLLCNELSISLGIDRDNVRDYLIERVKAAEAKRARKPLLRRA